MTERGERERERESLHLSLPERTLGTLARPRSAWGGRGGGGGGYPAWPRRERGRQRGPLLPAGCWLVSHQW